MMLVVVLVLKGRDHAEHAMEPSATEPVEVLRSRDRQLADDLPWPQSRINEGLNG